MATQISLNCNKDFFTWSVFTKKSPLTKWGCHDCGYTAYEDEYYIGIWFICSKKMKYKLENNGKIYLGVHPVKELH